MRMENNESIAKVTRYMKSYFQKYLPQNKSARVLDAGCGIGTYLKALRNLGYTNITGFDIDESCVLESKNANLNVKRMDLSKEKTKKKYACIISFDVIEHLTVEQQKSYIMNCLNMLEEGGNFIIRTPNMNNPFALHIRYIDITHKTGFTDESMKQLLDEIEIDKYKIKFFDIYTIKDPSWIRFFLKLFAKIFMKLFDLVMKVYYYCFNGKWKNMNLDLIVIIRK